VFAQMWHDFVSIKTHSGLRERGTLCTELAFHIGTETESLAASRIFQSRMFRSNSAGWQTDRQPWEKKQQLTWFCTLCRIRLSTALVTKHQPLKCRGVFC
jgi:hypothetical protein